MARTEQDQLEIAKAVTYRNKTRLIEMAIWSFAVVAFISPVVIRLIVNQPGYDFEYVILENYNAIMAAAFIFIIPFLFGIVFGKLPVEFLITGVDSPRIINIIGDNTVVGNGTTNEQEVTYTLTCIKESTILADRIWFRSGAYLFVGGIIAFVGVAIFYSPIFPVTVSTDIKQRMIDYLPRFGALFFIEFVAFFFLKQYRIMLVEFRYYESIKRKRQDNLHLMEIIEKYKDNLDILKIVTEKLSYTTNNNISAGETMEILETEKIQNNDLDFLAKITEMVKALRSK